MLTNTEALIIVLVVGVVTAGLRIAPFLIFGGGKTTSDYIIYLGKYLPHAIIAMLVVYCLKSVDFITAPHGIAEIISVIVVSLLHLRWRNTLLSIGVGTVVYMVLIQNFF